MSQPQPHSLEAERALLGGCLLEPDAITRLADSLRPDDFYRPDHGNLWELLLELHDRDEAIDLVPLPRRMTAAGHAERYGGTAYVVQLPDHCPSTANLAHYADVIREQAMLRGIIRTAESMARRAFEHDDDVALLIERGLKDLAGLGQGHRRDTWTQISLILDEEINRIQEVNEAQEDVVGLTSGFHGLDQSTGGFRPGQLIILAARPGMGKTALALNMAQNAALATGRGVAIFSLEMTRGELVNRMLTAQAMVDAEKVRNGRLDDDDWTRLLDASEELRGARVFIDDTPALPIGDLRARARKLQTDHPELGLILVDYLQLMRGDDPRAPRIQQVGEISRGLKALAKDLGVPVVALSQLNRGVESRQDKRPMLSDLRESGAIEQDADVILFIYREDYYDKSSENPGLAEIIIAKQRAGSTGTVKLAWQGRYTRFDDYVEGGVLAD